MIQGCRLVPRACLPTYNTIQWCPELMRDHRQELLLHSHAFLEVLNQLQPTNHKLHNWAVKHHQVSKAPRAIRNAVIVHFDAQSLGTRQLCALAGRTDQ